MPAPEDWQFRVLVVDDNPDAVSSLALLLRKCGHLVQTASNGAQALEVAADFDPDCVISDIGMPDVDGYEFARRFRALDRFKETPLIALTAYADAEQIRAAGFDHYLQKPSGIMAITGVLSEIQALKSRVSRLERAAESQAAGADTMTQTVKDVSDQMTDLKVRLQEDVDGVKNTLKEEVQELKQELRAVQQDLKGVQEELKQERGQDS